MAAVETPALGMLLRISASSGGEGLGEESLMGDETTTGEELWTRDSEVRRPDGPAAGLAGKGGAFCEVNEGVKAVVDASKTSRTVCEKGDVL